MRAPLKQEFKRGLLWVSPQRQKEQTLVLRRSFKEQALDKNWIDMKGEGEVDTQAQSLLAGQIAMIPSDVPTCDYAPPGDSKKAGLDKQKPDDRAYLRKVFDQPIYPLTLNSSPLTLNPEPGTLGPNL